MMQGLFVFFVFLLSITVDASRCRTKRDLVRVPYFDPSAPFHYFGHPLIDHICKQCDLSKGVQNSEMGRLDRNKERELSSVIYKNLKCDSAGGVSWQRFSHPSAHNSSESSKIIVIPEEKGSSLLELYTFQAIYGAFYELGYDVDTLYWSKSFTGSFSENVEIQGNSSALRWTDFKLENVPNPFAKTRNYISFQPGSHITARSWMVNPSEFGRLFRWITNIPGGNHDLNKTMIDSHCIGAQQYFGEASFCSNADIINPAVSPYHLKRSIASAKGFVKENLVLVETSAALTDVNVEALQTELNKLSESEGNGNMIKISVYHHEKQKELADLYVSAMVLIDCKNSGTLQNKHAVLYDVITLSCDSRAAYSTFDFPAPGAMYRVDMSNLPAVAKQLYSLVTNYTTHIQDFKYLQEFSRKSHKHLSNQLDVTFFSRDVLFRYVCA
jgi:hypothetical protein